MCREAGFSAAKEVPYEVHFFRNPSAPAAFADNGAPH